ncbi:MAG TPA: InlB B-repeat-containing protein, partial [Myxococcota bacterium]|nr:InlB B-repeat-containing protein [Myxococcota bacterium]
MKLLLSKSLLASLVLAVFVSACGDDDPDTGPSTLTVTYSGNAPSGGTPPRDSNTYRTGDTVTILGPGTLVKDGFYFAGWTSTAGASYQPGDTFQMGTANVLLYASWSESPTYTVSYSGNGNTSGAPPQDGESYVAGETVTVLGAGTMTKEGNTFAGWTDGGSTYQAGGTFTMGAADVTLTAVWTAVPTYHVTYNANGATSGTAPVDTGAYPQGAQVTVLGQGTLAKTNASFGGWLMNATTLAPAASFAMPAANVELVAIWN